MYTVYHLPQLKKVGCTKRFEARMEEQYIDPPFDQYVKCKTSSIDEASMMEETLREFYGYKKDSPMTYKEKFDGSVIVETLNDIDGSIKKTSPSNSVGWNLLHIGATEEQLLESLNDYCCVTLSAAGIEGTYYPEDYAMLVDKARPSQYKDFYWQSTAIIKMNEQQAQNSKSKRGCSDNNGPCSHDNIIPEFQQIRDWATERGLYEKGDPKTQYLKLQEEAGEVARAILKSDEEEIIDGLGDTLVVLINLAHLAGYKLEDCLASAYDVISKRTGKMVNGTFVKDN